MREHKRHKTRQTMHPGGLLTCGLLTCGLLFACSSSVPGTVVYDLDGYGADAGGGGFQFDDAEPADTGAEPEDAGAQTDGETGLDGSEEDFGLPEGPGELRYALPNDNADDFGGFCIENVGCALQVTQNSTRKLPVQYLKGGVPVPGALVQFELDAADAALGELLSKNVFTDENGVAVAEIKGNAALGVIDVAAHVPEDEEVASQVFSVHLLSKAKGPLSITLQYVGVNNPFGFGSVKVRLIHQENEGFPACADMDLGGVLPTADFESPPNLQFGQPWTVSYPFFATWVEQQVSLGDDPVRFTVVGIAAKDSISAPKAAGCVDTGATVTWNPVTKALEGDSVLVKVYDIPPRLEGTYEITTNINLLSVLPDNIEPIFQILVDIVSDPIAGILSLGCKLGGSGLDGFCGLIFANPSDPNIEQLQVPVGSLVVELLNQVLFALLPEDVKNGLTVGGDIAKILTNLEISGTMEIKDEPDANGYLPDTQTKQTWTTINYKWSVGLPCNPQDPSCGKKAFNVNAFQKDAITGSFELWRDAILSQVDIGIHALNIKWGALVNYIVQKQVLPVLFGQSDGIIVDSYEKMIKALLSGKQCLVKDTCCDEFAATLSSQQGLIGQDGISLACETLIDVGTGFLEGTLLSLDADSGNAQAGTGLLLGATSCPLFDTKDDNPTVNVIEAIGAKTQPCEWDMTLTLGGNTEQLKATFWATRLE